VQSGHGGTKKKKGNNQWRYGSMSGGVVALPCDIVMAGITQHKVDMAAHKKENR